jgi:SAM-dependent methyltransferase
MSAAVVQEFAGQFGYKARTFGELCVDPHFLHLSIAMVNGCGSLTKLLRAHPRFAYSEYGSSDPAIPSEDLLCLSYEDNQFDILFTSDTLEHISDIDQAQREIFRVLRPGGMHIFTIPVVWSRPKSRRCAEIVAGEIRHIRPPSYHGSRGTAKSDLLVFWEFGADVTCILSRPAFLVSIYQDRRNPALTTFAARRPNSIEQIGIVGPLAASTVYEPPR